MNASPDADHSFYGCPFHRLVCIQSYHHECALVALLLSVPRPGEKASVHSIRSHCPFGSHGGLLGLAHSYGRSWDVFDYCCLDFLSGRTYSRGGFESCYARYGGGLRGLDSLSSYRRGNYESGHGRH